MGRNTTLWKVKNMEKIIRKIGIIINIIVFIILCVSLIYGLIARFTSLSDHINTTKSQLTIVIAQSLTGMFVTSLPLIIELKGRRVPTIITISDSVFIFLASIIGEVFMFYYNVWYWDLIVHFLCSILLSALWLSIITIICKPVDGKYSFSPFYIALSTFCFIMAVGAVWEVIEFTIDSIFGTNMQKLMVESSNIFNGGNTFENINGTDAEIATLFRTPKGYRYALLDTMEDIVVDTLGAILVSIFYFIMFMKKRFTMQQFEYTKKK